MKEHQIASFTATEDPLNPDEWIITREKAVTPVAVYREIYNDFKFPGTHHFEPMDLINLFLLINLINPHREFL